MTVRDDDQARDVSTQTIAFDLGNVDQRTRLDIAGYVGRRSELSRFPFDNGDRYSFSITRTKTIELSAGPLNAFNLKTELLDAQGNTLEEVVADLDPPDPVISRTLAAGTYSIRVTPTSTGGEFGSVIRNYTIDAKFENATATTSLAISAMDADRSEGNAGSTEFTFRVSRGGATTGTTTVDFNVTGNTGNQASAADFVDGLLPSGRLQFGAGETSKTITINVAGDTVLESDEGFVVTLSNASGGANITTTSASGIIRNDEPQPGAAQVSINPTNLSIPENVTGGAAIATIIVTDDDGGNNTLSLAGPDMAFFEIIGNELRLRQTAQPDFETMPTLTVVVQVDDEQVSGFPDDSVTVNVSVINVNDKVPQLSLNQTVRGLADDPGNPIPDDVKVADIVIVDDGGDLAFSLAGSNADLFKVVGSELFVRAGTILDMNVTPRLEVTVEVDDATLGGSPDASASLSISVGAASVVTGLVYADVNNNGRFDPGEAGIAGVRIDVEGPESRSGLTDGQGRFEFRELPGGEYLVRQTQPLAFIDGLDTVTGLGEVAGNNVFRVVMGAADTADGFLFGERGLQARSIAPDAFLARPTNGLAGLAIPRTAAGEATFVTFRSEGSGPITLSAEGEAMLELFDERLMPVARSVNGSLTANTVVGREYVLFVSATSGSSRLQTQASHALVPSASALHNQYLSTDVDFDGRTVPLDALLVINRLNAGRNGDQTLHFLDVNADRSVSPIDALLIVNRLNQSGASGEAAAEWPAEAGPAEAGPAEAGPASESGPNGAEGEFIVAAGRDNSLGDYSAAAANLAATAPTGILTGASPTGILTGASPTGVSSQRDPLSAAFPWDAEDVDWATWIAAGDSGSDQGGQPNSEAASGADADPYATDVDALFGVL